MHAPANGVPREDAHVQTKRLWVFLASLATILVGAIEGTIMATAMPTVVGSLGGFEYFSWTFTAYLLPQAVTIPIYGGLSDIYGRKPMLVAGMALFVAGSILCGFATSMPALVAFRVVQGLGAGALFPLAQTIIGDLYPGPERARMQGYVSSVWAVGSIIGPLVGGFIVAHAGWPWIFWINVPVGCAAAAMIVASLHERIERRPHSIDFAGAFLMAVGITLLMTALVETADLPPGRVALLIGGAIAALGLFVLRESKASEPMLPLDLLKDRVIAGANLTSLGVGAVMMGSTAFLSLYVQGVMGMSAAIAGLVLSAPSVSWPLGSALGGSLMLRFSYRTTMFVGAVPLIIGAAMLVMLDASRGALWATIGAGLVGIGFGFMLPTWIIVVQSTVGWERRGIATSMTVCCRIIGQAMGSALFGGVLNAHLLGHLATGRDATTKLIDPALRASLPEAVRAPLVAATAAGLHDVYLICAVAILVVIAAILIVPKGTAVTDP